ncbi:MAG: OmpA family protein [Planctomycetota bacterium]|nr:MAG: OmpA family protein [Planctomycetota bacterium]
MSRTRPIVTKLLMLCLLVVAVGCNEQNQPISEVDQGPTLEERIAQLEAELDQAARDRAAAEDQLLALRAERDRLQEQLDKMAKSAPAEGWDAVPGGAMTSIEGTVLFDSGKAKIKSSGQKTLDQIASVINQKFADHDIYIFGHTDNEPIKVSGWKDNDELSCQRALSVARHLRSLGVATDMCAAGWGEQRPVADNSATKTRSFNRRVEIFAMKRTS